MKGFDVVTCMLLYLLENTQEPRELQQRWAEQSEETEACKDLRRCENIPIIHQDKHTKTRETNLHGKTKSVGIMGQRRYLEQTVHLAFKKH